MHRPLAAVVVALVSYGALSAAPKLTPEALIKLHMETLTAGGMRPAALTRDVRGVCTTTAPARMAAQLAGTFGLTSSSLKSSFTLQFASDLYEGESFSVDGDRVDIAFAQPRTSSRSSMGNFVAINRVIVGEGLFGGVLNARWPLLHLSARQPKLEYDGMKKLAGRELHRLRYRAREKQGNLQIQLYFEPETYRHVATVYAASQAQGMGMTPESSSQQADMYFRLEEWFADFQLTGGVTLPKSWTVRYERSGNTATEWKYHFAVRSVADGGLSVTGRDASR